MAALKPILLFLAIWTTAPILVYADDATTTATAASPAATLVPSCAQGCFQSFLDVHEFTGSCGETPSLDCLCARYGSSGITIGEGAVQCIVAEAGSGTCSKNDASQSVISKAYGACQDQPNAVTPTLKTIVATLVTSTASPTNSPTPTTMITTSKPATETNAPGPTNTSTPTSNQSNKPSAALSGGQVAGVTVGTVSGVFVLLAFAFIARCARRKRLANAAAKDRSLSYDSESSAPGAGPGFGLGSAGPKGRQCSMQISPPIHVPIGPAPWAPKTYEDTAVAAAAPRLSKIGQALTPAGNTATRFSETTAQSQGSSTRHPTLTPKKRDSTEFFAAMAGNEPSDLIVRQQPADGSKPKLSVDIPANLPEGKRDSQVTEFAEDGEDFDPETAGANIWRPPPTDPTSASTYYVADKWGNWRRKSVSIQAGGPNTSSYGNMPPPKSASSATVPPLKLGKRRGDGSPSAASSVYSVFTPPQSEWLGTDNPMPPLPPFPKSSYAKMLEMNKAIESRYDGIMPQRNASTASNGPVGARSAWAKPAPRDSHTTTTTIADDDDLTTPMRGSSMMPMAHERVRQMLGAGAMATVSHTNNGNNTGNPNIMRSPQNKPTPVRPLSSHSWTSEATNWANQEASPVSPILGHLPGPPLPSATATAPQVLDPLLLSPKMRSQPQMPAKAEALHTVGRSLTGRGRTMTSRPSMSNDRDDNEYERPTAFYPASPASYNSTGSGLLAKRLGAERAADMSLETEVKPAARPHWMRDQSPSWDTTAAALPYPITPGWVPELTPTRRGDDLYLKVV